MITAGVIKSSAYWMLIFFSDALSFRRTDVYAFSTFGIGAKPAFEWGIRL